MGMQEKKLIYSKIIEVLRDISPISKNHTNAQQGFKYRRIDDFFNEVSRVFSIHGVFVAPTIVGRERLPGGTTKSGNPINRIINHYVFRFYAEDGSFIESHADGEACDSADKCTSKASSMALKYALMQTLCIPTSDLHDSDDETILPHTETKNNQTFF